MNSVFVLKGFRHDVFMPQLAPAMAEQGRKNNQTNEQIKLVVLVKQRHQTQEAGGNQDADAA